MSNQTVLPEEKLEAIPDALMFPIERIVPQQNQPRTSVSEEAINNLAASIAGGQGKRVAGTGLIHPLLVRWEAGAIRADGMPRVGARVEIIAGETRYWACKKAGLDRVPVIIADQNSDEAYEDALIENILRGDLTVQNEGQGFLHLKNKWKLTTEKLAIRLYGNVSKAGYINNRIDMTRLNPIVRELVDNRENSMTAARRIQTVKGEERQRELVQFMLDGGNFEQLNAKIQAIKGLVDTGQTPSQKREESEAQKKLRAAFPQSAAKYDEQQNADNEAENEGDAPAPKVNAMPRFDVGGSLQSIENQLESVADALAPIELPPATRAKYRQQIECVRAQLEKVEGAI